MKLKLLVVAALSLAACDATDRGGLQPAMSDSAGVRIMDYPALEGPLLGVGPRASFTAGAGGADTTTLFRVEGGALLTDSSFVIADAGNYRLVSWAVPSGFVASIGGRGEGPGEFQNIAWLQEDDGRLVVYDARLRRLTSYDMAGRFLGSQQFELERPDPPSDDALMAAGAPLGLLGDSLVIAYPMAFADPVGREGPLPLYGDLSLYRLDTEPLRPIGRFPLMEWYEDPTNDRFPLANRLETPRAYWSGRNDLFVMSDPALHRIDVIRDGYRRAVIREARPRPVFTPDSLPQGYALAADSLQAYRDVQIDRLQRIWVKPAVPVGTPTTRWRLFSSEGVLLGALDLPSDASVLDASATRLLLLRQDELDEESVEMWVLQPPAL